MLVAEDLALLLLDDDRGTWVLDGTHRRPVLAGAVLAELALAGRLVPQGGEDAPARARLEVVDASPTGDDVLDAALRRVAERAPARPGSLLAPVGKGLEEALVERLVAAGAVRRVSERVLLLFPVTRLPAQDGAVERGVRQRVGAALRGGRSADERTAALVALLSSARVLPKVVDAAALGMGRRELEAAGRAVAADDRIAGAVRRCLQGIDAAVLAVITSTATTAGS